MGEAFDEPTIKVHKAEEGLDFLLIHGCGPLHHTRYLDWIHTNFALRNDKPKILDRGLLELAFFVSKKKFVLAK